MDGLADKNNDGKISLLELQQYLTDKVSTLSDGRQIPLVSGDLSKCVAVVNPTVLAAVKKEQSENYPTLAKVNYKGRVNGYLDTADRNSKELYETFEKNLEEKKLILPKYSNAMYNYRAFEKRNPDNELTYVMKRDLASALNEKFDSIVAPLLKGETSYSSREQCQYVSVELDSCLRLLGEQHYMYKNIEARKLYMDAMALTWALTESEFNIAVNEKVQKAVDLLEESEKLEPNAAYTISALGTRYYYLYQYKKAFEKFQKYLDLQPNDFYAKYTLANLFFKLKEYTKAEMLLKTLIDSYPEKGFLYTLLCDVYFDDNNKSESLLWAKKALNFSTTKSEGYFDIAVYYQKMKNLDSAKYYYELSRADDPADMTIDNNIGYAYLLNQNLDSALFYLNRLYKVDSTFPYVNFNLATIDLMQEKYYAAMLKFVKVIDYSSSNEEVFITDLELYFNKKYHINDVNQFNEFRNKVYEFNIQYMSYVSVLYCYLREPRLFTIDDKIALIFSRMKSYSEYDGYTYYHYACYKALQKNKKEALENLQKSLELGFGNYFMVTSDADLDYIRDTPEFTDLLKKYFPDKAR